jgi:hypothetical protein
MGMDDVTVNDDIASWTSRSPPISLGMAEDPNLTALRAKRLAELSAGGGKGTSKLSCDIRQKALTLLSKVGPSELPRGLSFPDGAASGGGGNAEQEQAQREEAEEEMRRQALGQILDPSARERCECAGICIMDYPMTVQQSSIQDSPRPATAGTSHHRASHSHGIRWTAQRQGRRSSGMSPRYIYQV